MAGGSQIIISSNGITIKTPGEFKVFAGKHKFESGAKVNTTLPLLPDAKNPYVLQYLVKDKENQIMADKLYLLFDEDGNIQKGKTDQNGFMNLKTSPSEQKVTTRVMVNEIEMADEEESGDEE